MVKFMTPLNITFADKNMKFNRSQKLSETLRNSYYCRVVADSEHLPLCQYVNRVASRITPDWADNVGVV